MKKYIRTIGCMLLLYSLVFLCARILFTGYAQLWSGLGNPSGFEDTLNEILPLRGFVLSPWQKCMSMTERRYFSDSNLFLDDHGQILKGSGSNISMEYAYHNVVELKEYCDLTGRNFLYVILPGKPFSDDELLNWGIQCKRNAGANLMAELLEEQKISCFDARTLFSEDNDYHYFFKTDHHWTPDAGFLTAHALLEQLNQKFGYAFNADVLDANNFSHTVVPDRWIGEYGEKNLGPYADKDDFITIKPTFPVSLRYKNLRDIHGSGWREGGFDILLDESLLEDEKYDKRGLYYYYLQNNAIMEFENEDEDTGDILILKDSFSNVMLPYLSLGISHITAWDMRDDKNIYEYLKDHPEIETVMIAYNISAVSTTSMNDFR